MKICHVIFSLATGGTETMLVDIVNEQIKAENVTLIIVNNVINNNVLGKINTKVKVIMINRIPLSRNPIPLGKINLYLWLSNPDIIHFHNVNGIELSLSCFRKKALLTVHDTNIQYSYFAKYRKIFAISQSVQKDILVRYGIDSTLIYNGIKTSNIVAKSRLQQSNSNFKIVQIGRLQHEKKGQDLLIKAIAQLIYNHGQRNISLDFIGDGPSMSYLKTLTNKYKLEKHILFSGNKNRDYIYTHLCDYDLLVQPSIYEGFGLTVIEGMAAKIPVLVSDVDGPMEIIEYGKYGYYFTTGDINNLAEKIDDIIAHYNDNNNIAMIENAYGHVIEKFDIRKTAANYINEYKLCPNI